MENERSDGLIYCDIAKAKSKNLLTILHQNIDSLATKINRLNHFLQTLKPDLVILSEHGLKEDQLLTTKLPGYVLVGGYSRKSARKGGVATYVNENLGNSTNNVETCLESIELTYEHHLTKINIKKGHIHSWTLPTT